MIFLFGLGAHAHAQGCMYLESRCRAHFCAGYMSSNVILAFLECSTASTGSLSMDPLFPMIAGCGDACSLVFQFVDAPATLRTRFSLLDISAVQG